MKKKKKEKEMEVFFVYSCVLNFENPLLIDMQYKLCKKKCSRRLMNNPN